MPRQARIDYPGALHNVMGRGINNLPIFKSYQEKKEFHTSVKALLQESSLRIYAWRVMSNHFHLLLQTGKTGLSEFTRKLLTSYAINYNLYHKRKGHLFQNRYKSILREKDEYLLPSIRYIHLNPVKAGLITFFQLKKYSWTGHHELINGKKETLMN